MQRRIIRISLIVLIVLLFALTVSVRAENEPSLESLIVSENTTAPAMPGGNLGETGNTVSNETTSNNENGNLTTVRNEVGSLPTTDETVTNASTDVEDDVPENEVVETTGARVTNTSASTGESTYIPHTTVQPTQSYSTVATIPEANLSLNNILNVILIAIGVIIILLAIAIIIRLK